MGKNVPGLAVGDRVVADNTILCVDDLSARGALLDLADTSQV
jgi:hypothetical protein